MSIIRIGITQRIVTISNERTCDALEHAYLDFFSSRDIDLIPIPSRLSDPVQFLKQHHITHLILSGGGDVHTGKLKTAQEKRLHPREVTETMLIAHALKEKMPVIGICRGAQALNVYFGGHLAMLKEADGTASIEHVATLHDVTIVDPTLARRLKKGTAIVNSYHAFGIPRKLLAKSLNPFAIAGDDSVEGFSHQSTPVVGVMWHPERTMLTTKIDDMLIVDFIGRKGYWQV